jgi:transposase
LPTSHIAQEVGIGRKTVSRWLQAGSFPERAPAPRRPSILDPYEPYLRARWAAGCHNARQLWRELQAQGFPGAASLVRRFVARWRPEPGRRGQPARGASPPGATLAPPTPARIRSPRQARWLLRPVEELRPDEQVYRRHLLDADAELRCAYGLAVAFGLLLRERQREQLDPWLTHAERSGMPEFREFVRVMRRDYAAVAAALSSAWSSGQTEGQITRLKSVKRQMYGRAGFALLKQRVLAAA